MESELDILDVGESIVKIWKVNFTYEAVWEKPQKAWERMGRGTYRKQVGTAAERAGIRQEELAAALEVSRQTIGSLENGRYNPSILLAFKIARYFGMSIEEIFYL